MSVLLMTASIVLGIVASVALTATASNTQSGAAPVLTGNTELEIVAAAERGGAAFAVDGRAPSVPAKYFTEPPTPGPAERKCVAASGMGPIRSGQWVLVATQGSDWGCFILKVL